MKAMVKKLSQYGFTERNSSVWPEFLFQNKKRSSTKISYARHVYESVENGSLSQIVSRKSTEKGIQVIPC